MKHLTYVALCLFTCLMFSSVSTAQDSDKPQIKIEYDRFKDNTLVSLRTIQVTGGKYDGLHIGAVFNSPGKTIMRPDIVSLTVMSVVKGYNFPSDTNMYVIADNERIIAAPMQPLGRTELIDKMV